MELYLFNYFHRCLTLLSHTRYTYTIRSAYPPNILSRLCLYLIHQGKPSAIYCTLAGWYFLHRFARFCQGQFHKALIRCIKAPRLTPKLTEIRLELAVNADVIIRIVANVRHSIDMSKP